VKKNDDIKLRPFDIAIDPYSRVLFYSCSENNAINFTHLDTKLGGPVISGGQNKPRFLAVNPWEG